MLPPEVLPPYVDAETADVVAIERGRIITDTYDRLIRLQEWLSDER